MNHLKQSFSGLSTVNLELTSRCNKSCWCCGRRKIDKEYPEIALKYGDMDYELVESIAQQLPEGIVVQFHNNGEPLLFPRLREALDLFPHCIRCLDTNGKLLIEKSREIIGNLDTITISVFSGDAEQEEQYKILKEFLKLKGKALPRVVIRCLGEMDLEPYKKLGLIATRVLHSPLSSSHYKRRVTIPEIGICLDALSHLSIQRTGKVSMCVRFDPLGLGVIGDATTTPLVEIWASKERSEYLALHIGGRRQEIPLCSHCDFWGVATGW